jgi:LacI family transcriptional regulator
MAIGVLQELRRQGLRVPDDISVMGIDDITVAQSLAPALTTVAVPLNEMGESPSAWCASHPRPGLVGACSLLIWWFASRQPR